MAGKFMAMPWQYVILYIPSGFLALLCAAVVVFFLVKLRARGVVKGLLVLLSLPLLFAVFYFSSRLAFEFLPNAPMLGKYYDFDGMAKKFGAKCIYAGACGNLIKIDCGVAYDGDLYYVEKPAAVW